MPSVGVVGVVVGEEGSILARATITVRAWSMRIARIVEWLTLE